MKLKTVFCILFIMSARTALAYHPSQTFMTSTGALFEKVTHKSFPTAWKAPNGLIWSNVLGDLYETRDIDDVYPINGVIQKSAATEACRSLGGELPSIDDYRSLKKYFESYSDYPDLFTDIGLKDLHTLFPETNNRCLTTVSLYRNTYDIAHCFNGGRGHSAIDYFVGRTDEGVRSRIQCVGKAKHKLYIQHE